MVVSGAVWLALTSAPAVARLRPIRPLIGAVIVA
jgi:hypothetical protein